MGKAQRSEERAIKLRCLDGSAITAIRVVYSHAQLSIAMLYPSCLPHCFSVRSLTDDLTFLTFLHSVIYYDKRL